MREMLTEAEQEALLGRKVEQLLTEADRKAFTDRACLITGAGGSVGSELARQIAASSPSLLLLVDHSEQALFRIEHELKERWPSVALEPILCDVSRASTVARVLRRFRPDIVFHAAAYKHVTMAERAVCAAARVNVLGTCAVLAAAQEVGAQFVLISSDKAAAPRSVMGATKRMAETATLIEHAPPRRRLKSDRDRGRNASAVAFASHSLDSVGPRVPGPIVVRFGNILASSGSFVEIMRERIRDGRPVLVTDPNATRFFMTVTEAVSLVMKASVLARGGETFWLDMGDQVRIGDLAERLLDLAEQTGVARVPIEIVGLRPGEKLAEQLASQGVSMRRTAHARIWVARQSRTQPQICAKALQLLRRAVARDDGLAAMHALTRAVSDFEPSEAAWASAREGRSTGVLRRRESRAIRSVA